MSMTIGAVKHFFADSANVCAGMLGTIIGYFLPIRDIVHFVILLFIMDVIFGYLVDRQQNKARFKVKLVWNHTIPRMLISIVIVMATFMWDRTYEQDVVSTYNVVGWFISGVLIFSIAENAFLLTKWDTFLRIRNMIRKNINEKTGEDLSEDVGAKKEMKDIFKKKRKNDY